MTQDEIKHKILQICKVAGYDGDFNVVSFHVLCDKLKQIGAEEEREACAKVAICYDSEPWKHTPAYSHVADMVSVEIGKAIRARGEA